MIINEILDRCANNENCIIVSNNKIAAEDIANYVIKSSSSIKLIDLFDNEEVLDEYKLNKEEHFLVILNSSQFNFDTTTKLSPEFNGLNFVLVNERSQNGDIYISAYKLINNFVERVHLKG